MAADRLPEELLRRIREDEAFRRELLGALLGEEFLQLPPSVRSLEAALDRLVHTLERERQEAAERQRRTDEQIEALGRRIDDLASRVEIQIAALTQRIDDLTVRMERVEAQIEALTVRMERVEAQIEALTVRMERVEAQIEALTVRMERVEAQIEALTVRMERVEAQIEALARRMQQVEHQLAELAQEVRFLRSRLDHYVGITLELRYHQRASAVFGRFLRRARAGTAGDFADEIMERLSERDAEDAFALDLLVRGIPRQRPELGEVWVAMEVSAVVDRYDVERAVRRAALLRTIHPRVVPAVAGERLTEGAEELVASEGVVVVRDGTVSNWEDAALRWLSRGRWTTSA